MVFSLWFPSLVFGLRATEHVTICFLVGSSEAVLAMSLPVINIALIVSCYSYGVCLCVRVRIVLPSFGTHHFEFQLNYSYARGIRIRRRHDPRILNRNGLNLIHLKTHPVVCVRRSIRSTPAFQPETLQDVLLLTTFPTLLYQMIFNRIRSLLRGL